MATPVHAATFIIASMAAVILNYVPFSHSALSVGVKRVWRGEERRVGVKRDLSVGRVGSSGACKWQHTSTRAAQRGSNVV